MSVCPSVRMIQLCTYWTNFHGIPYFSIFRKYIEKIQISLKSGTLHEDQYSFWSYLAQFFLEWEILQTKVAENIKMHILCSMFLFFRKSCRLWGNVEKYSTAGQATYENTNGARAPLHTGRQRLHTHTQNMQYLLRFHGNSGYTNAPRC